MISKGQEIERLNKVKDIISKLRDCISIKEISIKTNIPTSTIQRYLNNTKLLKESGLHDEDINNINTWLRNAKRIGLSKGGKNSQEKYTYDRDNFGHYNGMKRK